MNPLKIKQVSLFVLIFSWTTQAYAISLHNNNPLIKHKLNPGEAVQGSVELMNNGAEAIEITAYLEDWRYSKTGDGSKEFSAPQMMARSSSGWISFFPRALTIPPGGRGVVDYTVRVPLDASLDGGYYSVLFFESIVADIPSEIEEGASIRYAARIGSLIMTDVESTVRQAATLSSSSVSSPPYSQKTQITTQLGNSGNVFIKCKGLFHIMTPDNLVAGRGELPLRYIWPGDEVSVDVEWSGSLGTGSYNVVLTYDCGEDLVLVEEASLVVP